MSIVLLLLACTKEAPPPPLVLGEPTADGTEPVITVPATGDPATLYAACKERVEGKTTDNECASSADCAPVGCSHEVCVLKGTDLNTLCDTQPCFAVLDRCECNAGHCTWSLKESP